MTTNPTHLRPVAGEPRLASIASWAVLVASFGLSASTWITLAELAGFTARITIPGTSVSLALAWLMPIAVDGYVVVALVLWMAPVPARVAAFAKKNTYGAAGIGIAAQSAYHLLQTNANTDETWRVAMAAIVGALPPAVAGLAVHMRALIRRESGRTLTAATGTAPTFPAPAETPTPTMTVPAVPAPTPGRPELPIVPANEPAEPAETPARPEVPTPAQVATRITAPRPATTPKPSTPAPDATARPARPRPSKPATAPAPTLAPSTTDTPVTASDAAQPPLPIVAPDLLARATRVAKQYRIEHGTPITPGQLAVRLKVTSDEATQALAVLDLDPQTDNRPVRTANGRPVKATR
jgi:outer membrane biosynthesis protein TonB